MICSSYTVEECEAISKVANKIRKIPELYSYKASVIVDKVNEQMRLECIPKEFFIDKAFIKKLRKGIIHINSTKIFSTYNMFANLKEY